MALDRSALEGLSLGVDLFAKPAELSLGNAAHPHRLAQIVHRAGRHAVDVSFLDHRGQRLLSQ